MLVKWHCMAHTHIKHIGAPVYREIDGKCQHTHTLFATLLPHICHGNIAIYASKCKGCLGVNTYCHDSRPIDIWSVGMCVCYQHISLRSIKTKYVYMWLVSRDLRTKRARIPISILPTESIIDNDLRAPDTNIAAYSPVSVCLCMWLHV